MVGILVSFWDGLFSGAMLVLWSVYTSKFKCMVNFLVNVSGCSRNQSFQRDCDFGIYLKSQLPTLSTNQPLVDKYIDMFISFIQVYCTV